MKEYPVPATKRMGTLLITERCPRCKVAIVATDYREPELNGTMRRVFLDARTARDVTYGDGNPTDVLAREHQCPGRGREKQDGLWD